MIGYLFLIFAVLCGNLKGYVGKKSSGDLNKLSEKLYFGAVRTSLCALLGLVIYVVEGDFTFVGTKALVVAIISGISMSAFLLTWVAAVRVGAYVRLDVCCQTGMVIPCVFAAPLLAERVTFLQYIALGVLAVAIVLLSDRGEKKVSKITLQEVLLLFAVWLSSGVNSLTIKLYGRVSLASGTTFYNLVTFAVSAVALFTAYMIFRRKEGRVTLPKNHYTTYLPIMAITLYLNIFLQTVAAKYLDSMIMFPIQTVLGLFLSALMAAFLFWEKPTAKNIIGMVTAAIAIVIINLKTLF